MNLKEKRKAVNLTQLALAEKVGINKQQIYNFETGRAPIPFKHIGKLAKALKLDKQLLVTYCLKIKSQKLLKSIR